MEDEIKKVLQKQNFEWECPNDTELQVEREHYRNIHAFSNHFFKQCDLFGENPNMSPQPESGLELMQTGQINLKTKKPMKPSRVSNNSGLGTKGE